MVVLDPGQGLTERFVTLPDGRRLRAVVAGTGAPLVVFEAGLGSGCAEWVAVQRRVAAETSTVAYDRAGHAGSDDDPAPRTLDRLARDLAHLVDATASSGEPVVLVGHSWGGPILRAYAAAAPERVAGVVLVDTTIPAVMGSGPARAARVMFSVIRALGVVRLDRRLIDAMTPHNGMPELTDEDRALVRRDFGSRKANRIGAREAKEVRASLPYLTSLFDDGLPDVPIRFLMGGRVDTGSRKLRRTLLDEARREAARYRQAVVDVRPDAGHLVPQEDVAGTVAAVLDVLSRARAQQETAQ